ncbi:MAG: alkaline phosphatase family protein [Planctomycetota bacterium]|nr:alkaline phosphatase family protein [Planctomycetota bacterium]
MREGSVATPLATEVSPYLDPWISWTSVYTGRPNDEHGVKFLEQPPETVTGPRVWDIAADAGKTIGVYGSIMSWPPRKDVRGFWVPSTFSPTPDTFPENLQPIQELNLSATRAHNPVGKKARQSLPKLAARLMKLGLKPSTLARTAAFLAKTKLRPERAWEKVSLQPILNLDFFERLYRQHKPDLATFHTNHVAHYQHRYWRSMDPKPFLAAPSDDERRRFGGAIEYGYRIADEVLRKMWSLADENTVVILASGLGQKPYVTEDFKEGRTIVRVRDVNQIVDLCGVSGHCTPIMMMAPQWNLEIKDAKKRAQAERVLKSAWYRTPETRLFAYELVGDTINFNFFQKNMNPLDLEATCGFPEAGGKTFKLRELAATADSTPKEGVHDPEGVLIVRGAGVRHGAQIEACTNLDIAPTILYLLGLPIPAHMRGRVLTEALADTGTTPASARRRLEPAAVS